MVSVSGKSLSGLSVLVIIVFTLIVLLKGSMDVAAQGSSELDELQAPHNDTNAISCPSCHVPYGTAPVPTPPTWISETVCKSCHVSGGTATEEEYHISPAYADTTFCEECHNPHSHQDVFPYFYIKDEIATPNSGTWNIAFRDSTDFVHGDTSTAGRPYDGICEACHTLTDHYRNDGSEPSPNHGHLPDCVACHLHEDGFLPITDCLVCHDIHQAQGGGEYNPLITEAAGSGEKTEKISYHYQGQINNNDCVVCHYMGKHRKSSDKGMLLYNADTRDTVRYTGDSESMKEFCLPCHDANGAAGDMTPFENEIPVPNVQDHWNDVAKKGASTSNEVSCAGDGLATVCHGNAQGAEIKTLDAR